MKPADLQAGKTYVGKNGQRYVMSIIRDRRSLVRYTYCSDDGGVGTGSCSAPDFARWAEREASDEEANSIECAEAAQRRRDPTLTCTSLLEVLAAELDATPQTREEKT